MGEQEQKKWTRRSKMRTSSKIYEPQGDYHGNCRAQEKHSIYMGVCVCICVWWRETEREGESKMERNKERLAMWQERWVELSFRKEFFELKIIHYICYTILAAQILFVREPKLERVNAHSGGGRG